MDLQSSILGGLDQLLQLSFGYHAVIGLSIRLLLVMYGCYHDAMFHVKYTDIDYRVFTDAARLVMKGESPYNRHTYRYSPIIAWMLLPNVFIHESFGKVLFSITDIMISICIKSYILRRLNGKMNADKAAKYCSLFWLYNPFSIVISTRGNADSVSCLFILLSVYFLQAKKLTRLGDARYFFSGIFLGVSIHLRLYPIFFSFPMYLSLGEYKINRSTPLKEGLMSLIPNKKQIILTVTTILYFQACTYGMYLIYGNKFIFETYIYHLFRTDTRHNFSLFFYHSYLRMADMSFDLVKYTTALLVFALLFLISIAYGCDPVTLPFALFCQASVLVIYNTVVTSQYFLWYLSLLPLIVQDLKVSLSEGVLMIVFWVFTQIAWLVYAYFIEFLNQEVFIMVWISGVFFFLTNVGILNKLLQLYVPGYGFRIADVDAALKDH